MPEWTAHLRTRLAPLRLSPAREAEIVEELAQHLDQRYDDLRRAGQSDEEALRAAVADLLDPDALARFMRPLRQANVPEPLATGAPRRRLIGDLGQDLRYAARRLGRDRGFAATALLTLALGIGANAAIFALVDATVLRPLPFPNPDRLVRITEASVTSQLAGVAPPNMVDWRERSRTIDAIGAFVPNVGSMVLGGEDGTSETIPRQWVTAGYFEALGVQPVAGRLFRQADDTDRVSGVVLSEAFWRSYYNADPSVVGRSVRLDGDPWVVLGVAGSDAALLRTDIWAIRWIEGAPPAARRAYQFQAVARLRPGVTLDAARADLSAIAAALAREYPDTNTGRGVTVEPLGVAVVGADLRRTSLIFLGAVGVVLLICCGNVTNLLLTRASTRERELALRFALGADRRRVIRQLLVESLLLSAAGGLAGLALGAGILAAAPAILPQDLLPTTVTLALSWRVAAVSAAAAIATGFVFGLVPAWRATGSTAGRVIASHGRSITAAGGRLRSLLVAAQIATTVVLLVGAGLLLRTLLAVERVDRGYRAEDVLTMIVDPGPGFPTAESLIRFYEDVATEVRGVPGVGEVGFATTLPLGRSYLGTTFFEIPGDPRPADGNLPTADLQIANPTYFSTVDLPVVEGRVFDARDNRAGAPVAIVNEAFAERYLAGRPAVGARVALVDSATSTTPPNVREVIGVVRQVKGAATESQAFLQVYVPLAQLTPGDIFMVVRPSSGPAEPLGPAVRAALARVDTGGLVSVRDVETLDDVATTGSARHRFRAVLAMAFASLALVLAMVGLFGVLAYVVEQRTRDFGVRRALGAGTGDVLRLVAGSAGLVIGGGAIAGLALAAALSRVLATMLFGVEPLDGPTFATVAVIVTLTALVATASPAWRAARVDPIIALRNE